MNKYHVEPIKINPRLLLQTQERKVRKKVNPDYNILDKIKHWFIEVSKYSIRKVALT